MRAAYRWLVTAIVLVLVGLAAGDADAQDQAKDARGNVYFDDFDRDELGDQYSVVDPDPDRITLVGG